MFDGCFLHLHHQTKDDFCKLNKHHLKLWYTRDFSIFEYSLWFKSVFILNSTAVLIMTKLDCKNLDVLFSLIINCHWFLLSTFNVLLFCWTSYVSCSFSFHKTGTRWNLFDFVEPASAWFLSGFSLFFETMRQHPLLRTFTLHCLEMFSARIPLFDLSLLWLSYYVTCLKTSETALLETSQ